MKNINWDKTLIDCTFHGFFCTGCPIAERVKAKNATYRTKAGYLMNVYEMTNREIKSTLGIDPKKVVPKITLGNIYNPIFFYEK